MRFDIGHSTKPIVQSILFHLLIVTVTMVGWPFLVKSTPTAQPFVIVDVVKLAPKTNSLGKTGEIKASKEPEQEAKRRKPPPPPPPAPPPPEPLASATPEPSPTPKPVAKTAEVLPEKSAVMPKSIAAPKPKPKAAVKPKTVNMKTPVSRPKRPNRPAQKQVSEPAKRPNEIARKSQQKQKADIANGILQNLAKIKNVKEGKKNQKAVLKQDKLASANNLSNLVSQAADGSENANKVEMTALEKNALSAHIASCWVQPAGARGADKLSIALEVKIQRDANPSEVKVVDDARYKADRFFRAAANAARRAVLDCKPLPLPVEKYEQWKHFIFDFKPIY